MFYLVVGGRPDGHVPEACLAAEVPALGQDTLAEICHEKKTRKVTKASQIFKNSSCVTKDSVVKGDFLKCPGRGGGQEGSPNEGLPAQAPPLAVGQEDGVVGGEGGEPAVASDAPVVGEEAGDVEHGGEGGVEAEAAQDLDDLVPVGAEAPRLEVGEDDDDRLVAQLVAGVLVVVDASVDALEVLETCCEQMYSNIVTCIGWGGVYLVPLPAPVRPLEVLEPEDGDLVLASLGDLLQLDEVVDAPEVDRNSHWAGLWEWVDAVEELCDDTKVAACALQGEEEVVLLLRGDRHDLKGERRIIMIKNVRRI